MTKQTSGKILVVGGAGTVGGATVRALLARGASVRALVRSKERATHLGPVELCEGDVAEIDALDTVFAGVHTAFYVSPHEPNEEALAQAFVSACNRHGVRVVFVGVHVDAPFWPLRALLRLYFGHLLPTYKPKLRLSERVRQSSKRSIVLIPTNYFENDELFQNELLDGVFLQPFTRPFNRVSVTDIAEAAARVCLDSSFPPGAYPIVGPESLDGPACAAIWSQALGRQVTFRVDDAAFRSAVLRGARGKKASDFMASYSAIRNIALPTSKKDLARTTTLLERPPTAYADYVRRKAQAWSRSALEAAE